MMVGLGADPRLTNIVLFVLAATAGFVATHSPCAYNAMHTIVIGNSQGPSSLRRLRDRIFIRQSSFALGCVLGAVLLGGSIAIVGRFLVNTMPTTHASVAAVS